MRAHVTAIEQLVPDVLQVTIAFGDDRFLFAPGQYVTLRFHDRTARAYCIASAPERPEAIQLCIRLGGGKGSEMLKQLSEGQDVGVEGPFGEFLLPEGDTRPVIFLAGDTGIAPVRSIVLHMLSTDDRRRITVLYQPAGSKVLYTADFDPLAKSGAIVHESGKIKTLIRRHRSAFPNSVVMAAGFDSFLDQARGELESIGVDFNDVKVESFGALS